MWCPAWEMHTHTNMYVHALNVILCDARLELDCVSCRYASFNLLFLLSECRYLSSFNHWVHVDINLSSMACGGCHMHVCMYAGVSMYCNMEASSTFIHTGGPLILFCLSGRQWLAKSSLEQTRCCGCLLLMWLSNFGATIWGLLISTCHLSLSSLLSSPSLSLSLSLSLSIQIQRFLCSRRPTSCSYGGICTHYHHNFCIIYPKTARGSI